MVVAGASTGVVDNGTMIAMIGTETTDATPRTGLQIQTGADMDSSRQRTEVSGTTTGAVGTREVEIRVVGTLTEAVDRGTTIGMTGTETTDVETVVVVAAAEEPVVDEDGAGIDRISIRSQW